MKPGTRQKTGDYIELFDFLASSSRDRHARPHRYTHLTETLFARWHCDVTLTVTVTLNRNLNPTLTLTPTLT